MELMDLHATVREQERTYTRQQVTLGKYVTWSMYDTIETIDAYLNSKHTSGPVDSLGREKPFFNIVVATANIWMRTTDLDRKDVRMLPDSSEDVAIAFLATVVLQNWMREERFGTFLNEWGRVLARYGSAVVKFVERNKQLIPSVVPWNRIITDPIDFYACPRIEKFYKTKGQLRDMATPGNPRYVGYDLTAVESLIAAQAEQTRKTLDDRQQDTNNDFLELYEVHDLFPTYLLLEKVPDDLEPEDVIYKNQMHVITFMEMENKEVRNFTLYKGREKQDPYMLTHLIPEDGRTLAIGSVEYLFDAQWMQNHTMKNMKDTLDLSSKLIFQTSDANFVGRNVLSAIETGDILINAANTELTKVDTSKSDVASLISFMGEWQSMSQQLTNTPDSMRGSIPHSGTAARLQTLITDQATNLFNLMTQNKSMHLEDMLREFVIPFLKRTKLNSKDEIVALLDEQGVRQIDAMFVPGEAIKRHNENVKKMLLKGEVPPAFDKAGMEAQVQGELDTLGNKRFLKPDDVGEKTWKEALKGFEMRVIVDPAHEDTDSQAVLQTLTQMLQTLATNPQVLQDPNAAMLFSRILTQTGVISPLQITRPENPQLPAPTQTTPTASPPSVLTAAK